MTLPGDAGQAFEALVALMGCPVELLKHKERNWASATFQGARHSFVLKIEGDDSLTREHDFTAALPDHEFAIPGQLVCSAGVMATEHDLIGDDIGVTLTVELLLLEED